MANEKWQERVKKAQQMAAERLGIEVSTFAPPRQPGAGGADAAGQPAQQQEATATQGPGQQAGAVTSAPVGVAAERIAEAKARAVQMAQTRVGTNGAGVSAPAARPSVPPRPMAMEEEDGAGEAVGQEGMNRREFLSYAWGSALGLLTLEAGAATYFFMYPRFRAGEFGGKFNIGAASTLPAADAAPAGNTTGKFWLVDTEDGPKALYMVCTHLGCLYKWEPSAFRFECPCHGSKFSHDGHFIEGPAPRSLDQFLIEVVQNGEVIATTEDTGDAILPPAVPGEEAQLVVDTGNRLLGKPATQSPAQATEPT